MRIIPLEIPKKKEISLSSEEKKSEHCSQDPSPLKIEWTPEQGYQQTLWILDKAFLGYRPFCSCKRLVLKCTVTEDTKFPLPPTPIFPYINMHAGGHSFENMIIIEA